jgi:hypothetical protein
MTFAYDQKPAMRSRATVSCAPWWAHDGTAVSLALGQLDITGQQLRAGPDVPERMTKGVPGPSDVGRDFNDDGLHERKTHLPLVLAESIEHGLRDCLGPRVRAAWFLQLRPAPLPPWP